MPRDAAEAQANELHEFLTDQRPDDTTAEHGADLRRFVMTVFRVDVPGPRPPWCFELPAPVTMVPHHEHGVLRVGARGLGLRSSER